ncbi:hypothetical protein JR334_01910 [Clostridia bacterium]|nr:hypothetical protein JR334_01910 [Clostridia bacterium]
MNAEERNKFLYGTRLLKPCDRKEMALDYIDKAKALLEQEMILNDIYRQMDYKSMSAYESGHYDKSIRKLDEVLLEMPR